MLNKSNIFNENYTHKLIIPHGIKVNIDKCPIDELAVAKTKETYEDIFIYTNQTPLKICNQIMFVYDNEFYIVETFCEEYSEWFNEYKYKIYSIDKKLIAPVTENLVLKETDKNIRDPKIREIIADSFTVPEAIERIKENEQTE